MARFLIEIISSAGAACCDLFQLFRPVADDGNRLVYLLGDYIEKYLLAVRRDIIEENLAGRVRHKWLCSPELQRAVQLLDGYRENGVAEIRVIEPFAIGAPQRPAASALRDLPFPLPAAERYDVHLRLTGLVGRVGEPAAVG